MIHQLLAPWRCCHSQLWWFSYGYKTYHFGQISTLVVEAWGLRNGLILANQQHIQDLYIKGDNQVIIRILQGHYACPWTIYIRTLIDDIRQLLWHFRFYKIKHIFREANQVAELLSKKFTTVQLSRLMWMFQQNPSLHKFVLIDSLRVSVERRVS